MCTAATLVLAGSSLFRNVTQQIIIIITITISFMQSIYTYIPETNHVPKEYNVAAILSLLLMAPISLVPTLALMYFYISTFRSMCSVSSIAVFCSSLTSWFPGMMLTYFLNYFEMVPVAPVISGITLVSTFYIRSISIVRSLYFRIFSASI
jgi:small-conductance mechanosensitive channel